MWSSSYIHIMHANSCCSNLYFESTSRALLIGVVYTCAWSDVRGTLELPCLTDSEESDSQMAPKWITINKPGAPNWLLCEAPICRPYEDTFSSCHFTWRLHFHVQIIFRANFHGGKGALVGANIYAHRSISKRKRDGGEEVRNVTRTTRNHSTLSFRISFLINVWMIGFWSIFLNLWVII